MQRRGAKSGAGRKPGGDPVSRLRARERFSTERDRAHTRHARRHNQDPALALPSPCQQERDTYPNEDAPLHASVLVGFNADNNELLFVESWAGLGFPRRMRVEEMEATAYLTFCFRP